MSSNGQTNGKLALEKFSFGVGDRFGRQAEAQLRACMIAAEHGVDIIPVWNKSNREHTIIGSGPSDARHAADAAIGHLGWKRAYHVDADHIRLETVDRFIPHSDFYTIDVADTIGKAAGTADIHDFARRHTELAGNIEIPGIAEPFKTTRADVERIAGKYLLAIQEGAQIYRHIATTKGESSWRPSRMRAFRFKPSPPSSPAALTRASIMPATWRNLKRNSMMTWPSSATRLDDINSPKI
jgi:hypothetical protein